MAEDIVSIGIALDTSKVLQGTRQVDAALKSVATASTTTAQATQKLDHASKTAGQSMATESKAAQDATQALRQMGKAAQDATAQVGGIGGAMRSFASQTGSFALAQVGVLGFQAALSTAKDALVDLVKTGVQMQNLRNSFTAASGSAKAGAEDFRFVVKTANELGLGLQSVAEQYRSLAAATRGTTLQGQDTRELFVTLSKAAQAYGLSTEQLGRAMTAFQQIISKGKVSMEELSGQLGEAIPGAMQIAARAYGTNTQALQAMIEKGVAAEEFTRRFTTQLGAEVPAAAARAGKGITQLGNEILALKDSIARSGLVSWIDAVSGKLAGLMRQTRETEEAADRAAQRRAEKGVGAETFEGLPQTARDQLAELQRKIADAEKDLATKERDQSAWTVLGIKSQTQVAKERLDTLKQEDAALKARIVLQDAESKERANAAAKTANYNKDQVTQVQTIDAENKKTATTLDSVKKAQDDFNKAAALAPEVYGKANGTLKEQLTLLEQRNAITKKGLTEVAEQLAARPAGAGAIPADLQARKTALQEQYRAETTAIESTKKAIEGVADAERKRDQDRKDADAEKKRLAAETKRLDEQQNEEVARTHFQSIEQLRRMAAQYTEVKASRDADTASQLAQSLATSQYREEAEKALDVIQKQTQALEDRRKVEEKLPKLKEEAEASAGALRDIERLQKQLEPSRRSMSTEERLAGTRAELAERSKGDVGIMAEADRQIKETLDTERWDKWAEAGIAAFDHVGDALADFVFKGKADFKGMMDAIAQDLFRFATQTLMEQGTKKGGWLEMGLAWGQKALNVYLGASGGGSTSGATFAGGDAPGMQHGGPVSAGQTYMVGEAGPELFVPRQSGTVLPHGQGVAQPTVVNVHVSGVQDAQSFVQSRGAVSRAMMGALAQARQQM